MSGTDHQGAPDAARKGPEVPHLRTALGFRWDGVVTLGNLLTGIMMLGSMVSMAIGIVVWGAKQEARIERAVERQVQFESEMRREQERDARSFIELKSLIMQQGTDTRSTLDQQGRENRAALDRISDKLDRKADK